MISLIRGGRKTVPFLTQAAALWRWSNFVHKRVPAGKKAVLVNMDETCIRFHQTPAGGLLVEPAAKLKQTAQSLKQNVSTQALRGSMTLVAFVCNDRDVQRRLPQVLISSRALCTVQQTMDMRKTLPENVFLWIGEKAWVTSAVMVRLMTLLHDRVRISEPAKQIILFFDAFRAHWTSRALNAMARLKIMPCVIPAKLTCILQPLDTHIFGPFKHWLRVRCQQGQTQKESGKLDAELLVKCVCHCIQEVLEGRSWQKAFLDTGLSGDQASVSQRVLAQIGLHALPSISCKIPELHHLQVIFPGNSIIPIGSIFACYLNAARVDANDPRNEDMENSAESHCHHSPWHGRLRSSSHRAPTTARSSSEAWPTAAAMTTETPAPARRRLPWARPLLELERLPMRLPGPE